MNSQPFNSSLSDLVMQARGPQSAPQFVRAVFKTEDQHAAALETPIRRSSGRPVASDSICAYRTAVLPTPPSPSSELAKPRQKLVPSSQSLWGMLAGSIHT